MQVLLFGIKFLVHWAEVGAPGADDHPLESARAILFAAAGLVPAISAVVFLELTLLAHDVSVIGHRVAAEVDAFLQNFFHDAEGEFQVFLRHVFDQREGMDAGAPENFIRLNVADAGDERLVHEGLFHPGFGAFH